MLIEIIVFLIVVKIGITVIGKLGMFKDIPREKRGFFLNWLYKDW